MKVERGQFNPEELLNHSAKGKSSRDTQQIQTDKTTPQDSFPVSEEDLAEPEQGWQKIESIDPPEFLALVDPDIRQMKPNAEGEPFLLHKWQTLVGQCLGRGIPLRDGVQGEPKQPTSKNPYKLCLCAANGSGKDAFVIAPFAMWFICCKIRSTVIVTSSSGVQLTNQTENYLRGLADKINKWSTEVLGAPIIKVRRRRISCLISGSEIFLFATDEGTKAEGYHPVEANSEMAIIVNEAKSVSGEIFGALRRCTGYNYWINVSTPGEPQGEFYNSWELWENRLRVTYFDCPHQAPTEYAYDLKTLGEHDPLFRSKWLALFTFVGGKYVVNQLSLERLKKKIKEGQIKETHKSRAIRVGTDIALSTHGDETVVSAFRGNKHILLETFRSKDATIVADTLERIWIDKLKLSKSHEYIFIDDGGVGRAVISILQRKGWTGIKRILNQSPPKDKRNHRNRGAELWYKFAKLIEHGAIILLDDEKLLKQIASRKYKESTAGVDRLTLQAKSEMASEGLPSPDRADATVLAFTDTGVEDFITQYDKFNVEEVATLETRSEMLARLQLELRGPIKIPEGKNVRFSLNALLTEPTQTERLGKWKLT